MTHAQWGWLAAQLVALLPYVAWLLHTVQNMLVDAVASQLGWGCGFKPGCCLNGGWIRMPLFACCWGL